MTQPSESGKPDWKAIALVYAKALRSIQETVDSEESNSTGCLSCYDAFELAADALKEAKTDG